MRRFIFLTGILLTISSTALLSAATGAIGMAMADGKFQVDHAVVFGNSTLFDGSLIETTKATSQLHLTNGVQMRLAAASRAKIYERRLVLEQGLGELETTGSFDVEAQSLRISAAPGSLARIKVENGHNVLISAVRGALRVTNARGILVAAMEPGSNMTFEPQAAGAAAPTHASGCLLEKGGKFLLADRTTNVVLEVQGADLDKQLGNQVEISGKAEATPPSSPTAPQLIKVAGIKLVAKGGCTAIAKKLGAAAGAAGAATATGIGAGTITVIGGVAAAATVGSLAAVGSLPGQGDPAPSASR